MPRDTGSQTSGPPDGPGPGALVERPYKLVRIGSMIKDVLVETRTAELDESGRGRLRAIHTAAIRELKRGLSPEAYAELERLALHFAEDQTPSAAELRIAQAQLVGWLEGMFHGIQTALFLQEIVARARSDGIGQSDPSPRPLELPASGAPYL